MNSNDYGAPVHAELAFKAKIVQGARGMTARRVQEWLAFHACATSIDAEYGSATAAAVSKFQRKEGLPQTGEVDKATWSALTAPMTRALANGTGATLPERVKSIARQHLEIHPIELGGNNRGPWVRMYTGGRDGSEWAWCAGFVSFVIRQACLELGRPMPIKGSLSCDTLAAQAQAAKLLVTEKELATGRKDWEDVGKAFIFLVRRTPGDWTHTGFGFDGTTAAFDTVEGNSNNEGSSDGYEVCHLTRSSAKKEFIVLA